MPIHDWTRVDDGTFHDFHTSWITHLKEALNDGLLPEGYYAQSEQHAGRAIADILTLREPSAERIVARADGPVAVAEAPPRVSRKVVIRSFRRARRTIVVRRSGDHRVVAMIEIVSPGNKDGEKRVGQFVDKAVAALEKRIHLLIIDLLPPGPSNPHGMPGAISDFLGESKEWLDEERYEPPAEKPLTVASYVGDDEIEAYVEPLAVGDRLPDMPLFLNLDWYVNVPLESTYETAYRGVPAYWRRIIEGEV
jgi:hypothetical protein